MKYQQIEFIRTNCLMRKGYRINSDCLDDLSPEDCLTEDYIWNFNVDKEDIDEYLNFLLSHLTEEEQRIIYLKFYENKTFRQIKEEFAVSHQMIHKKFHRAIRKLKKIANRLEVYNKLIFDEVDDETIIKEDE